MSVAVKDVGLEARHDEVERSCVQMGEQHQVKQEKSNQSFRLACRT